MRHVDRVRVFLPFAVGVCLFVAACGGSENCFGSQPTAALPSGSAARDVLADILRRRTLVIATDADDAPMSVRAHDGSWSGCDVAVGRELARSFGSAPPFCQRWLRSHHAPAGSDESRRHVGPAVASSLWH